MAEVKWKKHSLNFSNTKNPQDNPRIQVKHQFVGSPRYRIYVTGQLEERLREFLESGLLHLYPVSWDRVRDCRSDVHRDFSVAAGKGRRNRSGYSGTME